jgi:hypothetical protein
MHIKTKTFVQGDQVLLYDSKYQKHLGKLQMHWLGPFIFVEIEEYIVFKLVQLNGILCIGWVNSARMKPSISIALLFPLFVNKMVTCLAVTCPRV